MLSEAKTEAKASQGRRTFRVWLTCAAAAYMLYSFWQNFDSVQVKRVDVRGFSSDLPTGFYDDLVANIMW